MTDYLFYLNQGLFHILDIEGVDHLLFIALLCAKYQFSEYKKLIVLLTSFTVGHSISLFFTAIGYQFIAPNTVELLIPLTIFITGLYNLFTSKKESSFYIPYLVALVFGFIHGMGFSNFFQAMMMGIDDHIILPLLAFNVGIEIGQLIIVLIFFILTYLYLRLSGQKESYWRLAINVLGTGLSFWWLISNLIT